MKERRYDMKPVHWCAWVALYIAIAAAFAWLFYDSAVAILVFAPFFLLYVRYVKKAVRARQSEEMTEEFIRMLSSVSSSLCAGLSAENAFRTAEGDMEKLYGKGSLIVSELEALNSRVAMGQRLSSGLKVFAARWHIREIQDFSVVFETAMEKGGSLPTVISSCTHIMESKRQAESEAKALIRGKQYEQRIMCMIPPCLIGYLRISSGSFTDVLYHNPLGIAVMTGALAVYVLAIILSEKIGDIKV